MLLQGSPKKQRVVLMPCSNKAVSTTPFDCPKIELYSKFKKIMPWLSTSLKRKGRNLYKQFVYMSKLYPGDGQKLLNRVKEEFRKHESCKDETVIKKQFAYARWQLKDLEGVHQVHKYRYLKRNYTETSETKMRYKQNIKTCFNLLTKDNFLRTQTHLKKFKQIQCSTGYFFFLFFIQRSTIQINKLNLLKIIFFKI
ncbi:hypothetical protein RFI_05617, partial [Reticulomyxa filosa]